MMATRKKKKRKKRGKKREKNLGESAMAWWPPDRARPGPALKSGSCFTWTRIEVVTSLQKRIKISYLGVLRRRRIEVVTSLQRKWSYLGVLRRSSIGGSRSIG